MVIIKLFSKIGIVKLAGSKAKAQHDKDIGLDESIIAKVVLKEEPVLTV